MAQAFPGVPIIGIGGIVTAADAVEFLLAGAWAVQVGTANFVDPFIWTKLTDGLASYLDRHNFSSVAAVTGSLRTNK